MNFEIDFDFRHPTMSHPIALKSSSNITVLFALRVESNVSPFLMPFFESLEPGIKIYIGDFLLFDYFLDTPIMDEVSS